MPKKDTVTVRGLGKNKLRTGKAKSTERQEIGKGWRERACWEQRVKQIRGASRGGVLDGL